MKPFRRILKMFVNMPKVYIFKPIDGVWRCVSDTTGNYTLADYLRMNNLLIDDDCQFCRIIRPEWTCTYRAYGALRITLTFTNHYYEQNSKN